MEQRLSLVTLGVADLAAARAFYEALGWRAAAASVDGEVAFFQAGSMGLGLWSREKLAADSGVADDRGGWGGVTLAHNVRTPEEVAVVLDEARRAGATVLRESAPTPWGGTSGAFADPDGHRWEIAHNPSWPIDVGGAVSIEPA